MCHSNTLGDNRLMLTYNRQGGGRLSRLGTESLKRSIVGVLVPGAKVSMSQARIAIRCPGSRRGAALRVDLRGMGARVCSQ
jgi:hypothetical protein